MTLIGWISEEEQGSEKASELSEISDDSDSELNGVGCEWSGVDYAWSAACYE